MSYINSAIRGFERLVYGLGVNEWAVIAVCFVVVGTLCMRGYGSREYY